MPRDPASLEKANPPTNRKFISGFYGARTPIYVDRIVRCAKAKVNMRVDRNALEAQRAAEAASVQDSVSQKMGAWKRRTLADAFAPRPPVERVVAGLLRRGSISIWYGAPGVQKSLLIADLCTCVISGTRWLRSADGAGGFDVLRSAAAWLDLDNGESLTMERFEAVARGYGFDAGDSAKLEDLTIWPLPLPLPSGADTALMMELADYCKREQIAILVIDNLQRISAGLDERTNEVDSVMANLRMIAERANMAVVLIHHAVKNAGERSRKGDALRGHSSIEAAVDLAMMITREANDAPIRVECTKARSDMPRPITARLHYTQRANGDLATARFASERIETLGDQVQAAIIDAVRTNPGIATRAMEDIVLGQFPDTKGARSAIRDAIPTLHAGGKIFPKNGERNAKHWHVGGAL